MTLNDLCDYVIIRLLDGGARLNHLKLQKLIYYVQAWHLAFFGKPLVDAKFQAWIHGPVSRELYDRFAGSKSLYSGITRDDVQSGFDSNRIQGDEKAHIDAVLEGYASFSDSQLENMTHEEEPWISAREGYTASQRCEVEIDEKLMESYYKRRLST